METSDLHLSDTATDTTTATDSLGNMPLLTGISADLVGSNVRLYVTKGASGSSTLHGSFRLGVKNSAITTANLPVGSSANMLASSLRSSLSVSVSQYPVPLTVDVTRDMFTEGDRNVTRYTLTLQTSSDLNGHMVYETANGHNISLFTQRELPELLLDTTELSGAISWGVTELDVHAHTAPKYRRHLLSVAYPTVESVQETQTLVCSSWSHPDTSADDKVIFSFRGLSTENVWLHSHLQSTTLPLCTSSSTAAASDRGCQGDGSTLKEQLLGLGLGGAGGGVGSLTSTSISISISSNSTTGAICPSREEIEGDGARDTPIVYMTNITFIGGAGSGSSFSGDLPLIEITPSHFRNQTTLTLLEAKKGAAPFVQEVQTFTVTRTDSGSTKADAPKGHFTLQVNLSLSLGFKNKGVSLYTVDFLCNLECFIRQL